MKIVSLPAFGYFALKNISPKKMSTIFSFKGDINKIANSDVVEIFEQLAKIPSPPLKEEKVASWILDFCNNNKIKAALDGYKNVKLDIPATDISKKPLLLSAHMDVVGDDSPINLVKKGNFISTDTKRTLGADDKSGVAAALSLAKEISESDVKHGGLEILFTRDEEAGMSGIMNADFQSICSKYVLVLDEAILGKFDNSGAGYTTVTLRLTTPFGGHSGIDIADKSRLNAAKMIAELISKIPQGVYCADENGVVTSINVGTIIAGDIQNSAAKIVQDKMVCDSYIDFFMKNSVTNVINTKAMATLSIRSSKRDSEEDLRRLLEDIVDKFNKKYKGLAAADIQFEELMPIFEKTDDKTMENIYKDACKATGINPFVGSFPAGAETHIYAKNKNKNNEVFSPSLLGIANIFNMHSPLEKMDFVSLKKGYELLKQMFLRFNEKQ